MGILAGLESHRGVSSERVSRNDHVLPELLLSHRSGHSMVKQKCGQLISERASLHMRKLRRRFGVSNGCQKLARTRALLLQAQIRASPSTGKLQEDERLQRRCLP